eukprot:CAMPEP_0197309572 /NCGR_PEP_ID=MMETSP0891-20130614/8147_1 /TAXON_ID=44058 ORGANISM="Aureoumbra lagunensis, Strain CCMP1510" /NCGR_SAMPLE_ID=MMETSP0891 /ASSEMBLY_ACC=CAM_ASM_000534 /LENGTH=500 /DNA_ID=CAMNT_0042794705 /DNA_START=158 /DNA_END=1660 /DNA_ORIENTATION=+
MIRFIVTPIESLLCPNTKISRRLMDEIVVYFWVEAVIGGWCIPSCPLRLSGELPRPDHKAAIVIMNHQLDTDWLYVWEMLRVVKGGAGFKIVLLDDMRSVPILGKVIELAGFVFVRRGNDSTKSKQSDIKSIKESTKSLAATGVPSTLLLFPEGITVNAESVITANAYAVKAQRPSRSLLVVPRAAGLVAALRGFEEAGLALDSDVIVYDATMAYAGYGGEVPRWELGFDRENDTDLPNVAKLVNGRPGTFVRIDATAHRASEILVPNASLSTDQIDPDDRRRAEQWLDNAWGRKQQLLESFAASGDFPDNLGPVVDVPPTRRILPLACVTAIWTWTLACAAMALFLAAALLIPVLALGTFCFALLSTLAVPIIICAGLALLPFAVFAYTLHLVYRFAARAYGWERTSSTRSQSAFNILEPPWLGNVLAGIGHRSPQNDRFRGVNTDDADAFHDDLSSADEDDEELVIAQPIHTSTPTQDKRGFSSSVHRIISTEDEFGI